jgi:uncharacterized protein (TIGR02145 family)
MLIRSVIAILVLITIGSCNTTSPVSQNKAAPVKKQDSVLMDKEGNTYPLKVFSDNNLWMTANLKLNIPGSYCYEDVEGNCEQYGRLYTWESAQKGCSLLGEGWRLPTQDEWERLAKLYGGVFIRDSVGSGKSTYQSLLTSGSSQFNILLGGGGTANNQYRRLNAHGFYWTATETDSSTAWFYNFGKGSQVLYQQNDGEKTDAFSVRCLKDIEGLK